MTTAFEDQDRDAWQHVRATRRVTSEWPESRRDETGDLYRLITSGDAVCADDAMPDRWTDNGRTRLQVLCERCPLRRPCLQYALDHDVDGIWGGTTMRERSHLRRQAPQPVAFGPYLTQRST
jgi:hypothetical protein